MQVEKNEARKPLKCMSMSENIPIGIHLHCDSDLLYRELFELSSGTTNESNNMNEFEMI